MRNLSQIILLLLFSIHVAGQSPHGDALTLDCSDCHTTEGWTMIEGTYSFTHDSTDFPLTGQHQSVSCRQCHETLVFNEARSECMACHEDMHYQTLGSECERCHTPQSWIVQNITEIHQLSRFPLLGAHATADCQSCHPSASLLRFEPLGVECFDCHQQDYLAATEPNHAEGNFSTECTECHKMNAFTWQGAGINHDFFPLTLGHNIADCNVCHTSGDFASTSPECFSCHQDDYQTTENPNHPALGFSNECSQCHTTVPGWAPADFREHDGQFFPIYSGEHNGEWNSCLECHTNSSNYALFSCTDCHEHNQPETDEEHQEVVGYTYDSPSCFACHPTGDAEGGFDHNATAFPLTGAHTTTDCLDCHESGYAGTPTVCLACHTDDYNMTTNPSHLELGLADDCEECHTTQPEWKPALFPVHNEYYVLQGAHGNIASDCFACHEGSYVNTPNSCFACHSQEYNQTTDPNHEAAQFPTDCESCHSETAWEPSTFNHDGLYFPIYSGSHQGEWMNCTECHTNPANYALFSCTDCHEHNQPDTDEEHEGIGGYIYESNACFACHPTGEGTGGFNHNATNFPLTGAHIDVECLQCHESGYSGTSTYCFDCHQTDYLQSTNPAHQELGLPDDCAQCHTTDPGWEPAEFPVHNEYYALTGSHTSVDCFSCHEGNYTNTPNLCSGCHLDNFNQTTNPNHQSIGLTDECELCHTTDPGWTPAGFPVHDEYYDLTGAHNSVDCFSCHEGSYTSTPNLCSGCHLDNFNQTTNPNHQSLGLTDECELCHTTDPGWEPAGFPVHNDYYVLEGAHAQISNDCAACHNGDYLNTPDNCFGCHQQEYNQTTDPNHQAAQFPVECEQCHTQFAWEPSTFDHDGQYFPIYSGEHQGEWDACTDCHTDPTNYAIFSCTVCHLQPDMDDEHEDVPGYVYNSIACLECHPDGSGGGAFNHNNTNFPLTGAHLSVTCDQCHESGYAGTSTYCFDCHEADYLQSTNPSHQQLGLTDDCAQCHTTNSGWQPAGFPVHNEYYALTGAHTSVDCFSCHEGSYTSTPNLCSGCHLDNFNQTTNPNHQSLGLTDECELCHTTNPDWQPALFPVHNDFYLLEGAHAVIGDDCVVCHNGNYQNTPNTCFGCHQADYNATTDPNHQSAQFPTDCEFCHNQNAWEPANFNHDAQYFPIYSGEHEGEWDACTDCHTDPGNYAIFSCTVCHLQPEMDDEHDDVPGYVYNSIACLECHPDGSSFTRFNRRR